ncbi:isoprenylcysteine carboxylmethyltransferase family protein [Hoeflea sp. TYP-13]|uniref:isoprenylcysteine carboxylmethyltransferase family protein n=1 Tax=Hoeflea sp. TYP-13 TaxID=3230023 RepID=UPI0034C6BD2F
MTALGILGSHVWSMRYHFDVDLKQMPKGMNMLSMLVLASLLFMIFLTFIGTQPLTPQLIGLIMLIASAGLFWLTIRESARANLLAAFDEKLPGSLLRTGPYAYVRHPFYTSYLLLWTGWAISTWNIWALVPLTGIVVAYWVAARGEERKFASTAMAEEYASYAATTGRFFPKIIGRT